MTQTTILGTPFISLLFPLKVDPTRINTTKEGRDVCFKFLVEPCFQGINYLLKNKENFLFFIKEEIEMKRIQKHLKDEAFKLKVNNY